MDGSARSNSCYIPCGMWDRSAAQYMDIKVSATITEATSTDGTPIDISQSDEVSDWLPITNE